MSVAHAFKKVSHARLAAPPQADAQIPWGNIATPVVARGFDRILSPATVKKFRSDFLTLVGNIRRLKTYQDVLGWQEAVSRWREAFDQYIDRAIRELKRFRTTEIPVNLAELWEHDIQRAVGKIRHELYSLPMERYELATRYTYRPHERGEVEQQLFRDFQKEAPAWDRRVRRKAQEAWRDLDTVLKSMQDSLSRRDLELIVPQDETIKINGFYVTLRGFSDRGVIDAQRVVEKLRAGLRLYEQRAKAVYPWLLRYRVPLVVNNDAGLDRGGAYSFADQTIELNPLAFATKSESPRALVHILAHEMGHHIYRVVLSARDHEFWSLAIKGAQGPFDLRDVAKKSKEEFWVMDDELDRRDPIFALRGKGVMDDPRHKHDSLETQSGIAKYLARGNDPIITLTTEPITGYAAKNPEEAFCEALGMLVAYGPRAVLPIVRERLSMLLPQLRVSAATGRTGSRAVGATDGHPFIRLAEVVRQHAANVAKTGAKIDALVAGWAKTGEPNVRQLKLWLTKLQKAYEKGLVNPPANARPYETEFVKTTVHQAYNVKDLQGEAAYVVKVVGRAKDPDSWEAALQVTDMHTRGARRSLERIAERLTERAEAFMPERFKFGNFTIVDKYGLPYARANAWIEAVTRVGRILQSKGFGYLLYGDLVLAMSNEWDGQYRQNGDLVSLDLGRSSANVQRLVEVLIHELGHRLWFKFLDGGARDQFSTPWIDREQLAREAWENYKQVFTFPAGEAEKAFKTVWDSAYDLRVFERWLDQDPGRRVRWMQRLRNIYPNYQFTFVEDGKLSPRAFKAAQDRIEDLRKELEQSDSPDRKEDVQKQLDRYRDRQQKVWTDESVIEMYGVLPTFRDVQDLLEPHGSTYRIIDTSETANILREALRIAPPEVSVTPYGNTNRQEDFAELFEEVILGKVKDRQHALRLQAVLPRGRVVSATQLRRIGEGFYGPQYRMDVRADEFVHFLPADRADEVIRSGKLLQRPPYQKFGPDKVYAVSTRWGTFRPRVQTTHIQGPVGAILFRTNTRPLLSHPEEVIWDRDVELIAPRVISKAKAVGLLNRAPLRPEDEDFEIVYATVTAAARYWTVKQWLDVQQSGLDRIRDAAQRVDEAFARGDAGAIEAALQQYRADLERWDRYHGYLRPHVQADWRGARFIAVDAVEFQTDKLVPSLPTVIRRGDLDTAERMWATRNDRHGDPVDEINKALGEMARNRYLEHESTFGKFRVLDAAGLGFRSDDRHLDAPTLFRALKQVERLFSQKGLGYLLGGIVSIEYRPQARYGAAYFRRNDRLEVNSTATVSPDRLTRMLVHELGHRVWFRFLSSAQRDRFAANWIETGEDPEEPQTRLPSVTPYGTTNRHEDFAETFAEVVMGTQRGRRLGLKLQGVLPRGRVVSRVVATTMSRPDDEDFEIVHATRTPVTAIVHLERRNDEYVVWAPSYREIEPVLKRVKSLKFRYNPSDKTWRIPVSKLTDRQIKGLEKLVQEQAPTKKSEENLELLKSKVQQALSPLRGLRYLSVEPTTMGFTLGGDTYDLRDLIKRAGGRWGSTMKLWIFQYETLDLQKLQRLVDQGVKHNKKLEDEAEESVKRVQVLVKRQWQGLRCSVEGQRLVIRTADRKYRDAIKEAFPTARWNSARWEVSLRKIDPDAIKRFIAAIDDIDATPMERPEKSDRPRSRQNPVPGAKYLFSWGEGSGGEFLPPGTVLRSPKQNRAQGFPEFITVIKTTSKYFREDGLSFGVDDDQGYLYTYHCRDATADEIAELMGRQEAVKLRRQKKRKLADIATIVRTRGKYPRRWVIPKGQRINVDPQNIYGGGSWFVVQGPVVWYIKNNGHDGDDWSHNNVRTGGAGAIGWFLRDAQLAKELMELGAELGVLASVAPHPMVGTNLPFSVGDEVLYGKYKNKRGRIVRFARNPKGQMTVEIEPIPKGRKQNKQMGLFKIWTTPEALARPTDN